jgi:Sporulation and spore germination/WD40-like Beta Propeller Repeat
VASPRIHLLRPAVALAALLGLAACSAGVPQTGEVVTVSPVAPSVSTVDPETFEDPGGPASGLTEGEVAVGFMNAMNSGSIPKIQRWLTPKASKQVERWSRRTPTIRVYSVFDPGLLDVRQDKRIVPIRVKLVGQLEDGHEWYPATGDDLLNLELQNDNGDPRVANPGPVLWMRDVEFSKRYASVELFMVPDPADPSPTLAPVPVFVPRGADGDPGAPAERVERTLKLLLEGPQDRYDHLHTAIPAGTRLRSFKYADDVATVNLSSSFTDAIGSGELRVGQIVWTVSRQLQTAQVRILVEGRPVRELGYPRFSAGRAWRRGDEALADLWPQRSRERDGDSVLFVRGGEIYTIAPGSSPSAKVVGLDAPAPMSSPTWSPDHRWMAFLVGSGTSQVLWLLHPGGKALPVTANQPGTLSPPSWSPDSHRVYLLSRQQGQTQLLEVARNNLKVRQLTLPELPSGLEPASIAVSPDGASVLAVAERPDRQPEDAEPGPGGQLFVGQFGPEGVLAWSKRQIAPGLGRVFSPVWVDPLTVAFIAETDNKDDLGKLWIVKSDGWDPTAVLNNEAEGAPMVDIGNHLTVDPTGRYFVVTVRSSSGASLWTVDRQDRTVRYLTLPSPNAFDTDPSFASR